MVPDLQGEVASQQQPWRGQYVTPAPRRPEPAPTAFLWGGRGIGIPLLALTVRGTLLHGWHTPGVSVTAPPLSGPHIFPIPRAPRCQVPSPQAVHPSSLI